MGRTAVSRTRAIRWLRKLVATLATLVIPGVALAAPTPTLRAPRQVRVGEAVSATARHLVPGRYRLYIAITLHQGQRARSINCLGAVSPRLAVTTGRRTFRGTVPAKLACYQGVRVGTIATAAGAYRFQVASPVGPGAFSGRKSFVKHRVRIL